jgi:hypothetical protein
MDGRPILEAMSEELRKHKQVRFVAPWPAPGEGEQGTPHGVYTEAERDAMEERLRGLGYL